MSKSEMRECSECRREVPADEFEWTYDRYGNPWRKVCFDCSAAVEREIVERFEFDASYAGEALEPDDY